MAEVKFTPGPWEARGPFVAAMGTTDTYDGPVWGAIADVGNVEQSDADGRVWTATGTRAANANLIAAAPDLFAALVECRNLMWADNPADGWADAIASADAALAKAEGRS